MAYTISMAKTHFRDGHFDKAIWGAAWVVLGKVFDASRDNHPSFPKSDEEPRPTKMTRLFISNMQKRGLITTDDELEAVWLLEFYDRVATTGTFSEADAIRAITIADKFAQIP
jgi:hypothetical protein